MLHVERGLLPARRVAFTRIILVTMVMCVSDVFAWICNECHFPGAAFLLQFFNIIYDVTISLACYLWFNYVSLRSRGLENYSHKLKFFSSIPLFIVILFSVTNPLTGFLFTIKDNVYLRAPGIILHWVVSWGYLVCATITVAHAIRNTESRLERKQLSPLMWFIIPPAVAAALQMVFYGLTAIQCGITISIIVIAFASITDKVSKDSLTGLNNRNALDIYTDELIRRKDVYITVLMCDIDNFKNINDSLGHITGDIILKHIAGVLKSACGQTGSSLFLCRYGGDEFLLCGADISDEDVIKYKSCVNAKLEALSEDLRSKYKLGLSIGSASGDCSCYKDFEQIVRKADSSMYQEKHRKSTK